MQKLYLSFDIEADGPSPYLNNMLSFGISGITQDGKEVFSIQRNLSPLYNKKRDEKRNIIIFVRPQIIHSFKDYEKITALQVETYEKQANSKDFVEAVKILPPTP